MNKNVREGTNPLQRIGKYMVPRAKGDEMQVCMYHCQGSKKPVK
jgi:hypothetical protein